MSVRIFPPIGFDVIIFWPELIDIKIEIFERFLFIKVEEFLIVNPSSVNVSLRTWRIDAKTFQIGDFFETLDSSVCKNAP